LTTPATVRTFWSVAATKTTTWGDAGATDHVKKPKFKRKRARRFELRLSEKERKALIVLAKEDELTASGWVQRQIRFCLNALLEKRAKGTT